MSTKNWRETVRMFKVFRTTEKERRTAFRVPFDLVIAYMPAGQGSKGDIGEEIYEKCQDLSEGGLLFCSHEPFMEGAVLKIQMPVHGSKKTISVIAEVVRARQVTDNNFEMGVKFCSLSEADKKTIAALVRCYKKNTDMPI